jgi:two-component system response regulator AtoC
MPTDPVLPAGSDVLLLEDDATLRKRLAAHLRSAGAEVREAVNVDHARKLLREHTFDFALIDLHLPDGEGIDLLRENLFSETTGVVVMTAYGNIAKAVEAMRLGAGDYLSKPFDPQELSVAFARCRATREAARRDAHVAGDSGRDPLFFGESLRPVRAALDTILATERRLTHRLPPVLIEGETGTGKSVLARWLHAQGPRRELPLVSVNCAALPETLLEAELFGHERGAFTDAKTARIGLFEAADGGTLFLDEIAALTPAAQAKVLVAVEEGKIRRLGGTRELTVDVRLIAASNRPLATLVEQKAFRDDLYHRLNLLRLTLPPLRERRPDLLALARHLLAQISARHRLPAPSFSSEGEARLLAHEWRGNIRELGHELERALIFGDGTPLAFAHLGPAALSTSAPGWRNPAWRLPESGFVLDNVVAELIAEALRETNQNVSAAARRLGVSREFLRYRLEEPKTGPSEPPAS